MEENTEGQLTFFQGVSLAKPYSGAGKRKAFDDDRDLWPEMFRIIQEVRPTLVLGENVSNFANLGLDRTILNLESEGYEVQTFNIPACAVSAWHQRARIFVVARQHREQQKGVQKHCKDRQRRQGREGPGRPTFGKGGRKTMSWGLREQQRGAHTTSNRVHQCYRGLTVGVYRLR